ncbi:hypothetical protein FHS15_002797 [Paenibacillus castaneae]|uniref:hypothetical protein n=1 Tax=Paenibacillus castaneae TaxID=474957 RepID=UPI000C99D59C|nr:hypothetical protein [Paenibacillus castaneae]NIK77661.1 hypothetical protein [Paenibacillus castaneae]
MIPKRLTAMLIACCSLFLYAQAISAHPAASSSTSDTALKPVQVFDVAAGKVTKTVVNDPSIQEQASAWIGSVTGLAPQISNDESCSYVFRVPLEKEATIKHNDISVTSDDLFLFYCKDKPPLLLMFDHKRRPYLFLFNADIKPFIQKMGVNAS